MVSYEEPIHYDGIVAPDRRPANAGLSLAARIVERVRSARRPHLITIASVFLSIILLIAASVTTVFQLKTQERVSRETVVTLWSATQCTHDACACGGRNPISCTDENLLSTGFFPGRTTYLGSPLPRAAPDDCTTERLGLQRPTQAFSILCVLAAVACLCFCALQCWTRQYLWVFVTITVVLVWLLVLIQVVLILIMYVSRVCDENSLQEEGFILGASFYLYVVVCAVHLSILVFYVVTFVRFRLKSQTSITAPLTVVSAKHGKHKQVECVPVSMDAAHRKKPVSKVVSRGDDAKHAVQTRPVSKSVAPLRPAVSSSTFHAGVAAKEDPKHLVEEKPVPEVVPRGDDAKHAVQVMPVSKSVAPLPRAVRSASPAAPKTWDPKSRQPPGH